LDISNIHKDIEFLKVYKNFNGGFRCYTGYESNDGQVFVCVSSFALSVMLDQLINGVLVFV
jgi:prenyltransferase beta subunit